MSIEGLNALLVSPAYLAERLGSYDKSPIR